jgi:hypothetical protein
MQAVIGQHLILSILAWCTDMPVPLLPIAVAATAGVMYADAKYGIVDDVYKARGLVKVNKA